MPRRAAPRHATPRHATPRHATHTSAPALLVPCSEEYCVDPSTRSICCSMGAGGLPGVEGSSKLGLQDNRMGASGEPSDSSPPEAHVHGCARRCCWPRVMKRAWQAPSPPHPRHLVHAPHQPHTGAAAQGWRCRPTRHAHHTVCSPPAPRVAGTSAARRAGRQAAAAAPGRVAAAGPRAACQGQQRLGAARVRRVDAGSSQQRQGRHVRHLHADHHALQGACTAGGCCAGPGKGGAERGRPVCALGEGGGTRLAAAAVGTCHEDIPEGTPRGQAAQGGLLRRLQLG